MQQPSRRTVRIRSFVVAATLALIWPAVSLAQGEGSGDLSRSEAPPSIVVDKPAPKAEQGAGSKSAPTAAKPAAVAAVPDTFSCSFNDKTGKLVECSCKHVEACISLDRSKQCGDASIKNRPKGGGRCRP